jgi:hypothetical protein
VLGYYVDHGTSLAAKDMRGVTPIDSALVGPAAVAAASGSTSRGHR